MHTFVRSMSWLGRTRSPGAISSCKLPTALNATIALTPKLLKAAMFALEGTVEGVIWWLTPWRAIKAISSPDGRAKIEIGDDGLPHGYVEHISAFVCMIQAFSKLTVSTSMLRTSERLSSLYRPRCVTDAEAGLFRYQHCHPCHPCEQSSHRCLQLLRLQVDTCVRNCG